MRQGLDHRLGDPHGRAIIPAASTDHVAVTDGFECRKDEDVIDETPKACKEIEAVTAAQADLFEIARTLRPIVS